MDYTSFILEGITKILNQHSGFFEGMGQNLFRSFATIVVSWFGVRAVLSAADGGPGFNLREFGSLLLEMVLVYTMLTFYSTPIPGIGVSFTHLILDQATAMVQQLNQARVQEVIETLDAVESNLPYPTPYEILTILRFFIVVICISIAQAATLYVTLFGYVATAVLMLLGPVLIPFKIIPQMDWLFWGWFRSFIQYAFYQVVATAYVFIFGELLVQVVGLRSAPMSAEELGYLFAPLVLTLTTFVLGIIKVPALVFSLFSGRSGDYVFFSWRS